MTIISFNNNPNIRENIEPLFVSAFPKEERPEPDYFFSSFDKENNHLYGFYDKDTFIGFASVIIYKHICYIFFLAIEEKYRNQGYGSEVLKEIRNIYKDYVILLAYEYVDPSYPDYENRKRREQFYMNNGFKKNPLITNEFGVIFQTAYIGKKTVSFEEYQEIFKCGFGEFTLKHLKEIKQYKTKCDYCLTEFEYLDTDIDYRPWIRHGFVMCPKCGKQVKLNQDK